VRKAQTEAEKKAKWGDTDSRGIPQYPVHKAQADILASTAKYTAALAGSGGGKSVLLPLWLYIQIQKKPQGTFLIILPSFSSIESTNLVDRLKMAIKGEWKDSKKIFHTASGAKIHVKSAEYPEGIEGIHADAICLDEAKDISGKAWKFTKSRSGSKGAPILITTTPDHDNWVIEEIYNQCDQSERLADGSWKRWSSDGQYFVRQWGSHINPGYEGKELLEQERLTLTPAEFSRRYQGEVAKLDGLVYTDLPDHIIKIPPGADLTEYFKAEFARHPAIRVCGGIDWGYDPDPCAIIVGAECQDNRLYLVEEICENRLSIDEIAQHCIRLKEKWGIDQFFCDSSGKANIAALRQRGIPASKRTIPDINLGIQMVNARIRTGIMKVFDCNDHLVDEAKRYMRPKDRSGDYKATPIDKANHMMDAMRYLVTGMDYGRSLTYQAYEPGNEAEEQAKALARAILLGQASPDPKARAEQEARKMAADHAEWFMKMVMLDTD
jgi:hypothetical protein